MLNFTTLLSVFLIRIPFTNGRNKKKVQRKVIEMRCQATAEKLHIHVDC